MKIPSVNNCGHVILAGAWSKTMIGYGPEEENFALELTYNYGIDSYKNGNDLQYISLQRDVKDTKAKAEAEGKRDAAFASNPGCEDFFVFPDA